MKTETGNKTWKSLVRHNMMWATMLLVMMFTCLTAGAQTYTVTFNANHGTGTMEAQTFTAGVAQRLKACKFTKPKDSFTGWNTQADGKGVAYTDEQNITLTSDITLYAQWNRLETIYVVNAKKLTAVPTEDIVVENSGGGSTNNTTLDGGQHADIDSKDIAKASLHVEEESGEAYASVFANSGESYTLSIGTVKGVGGKSPLSGSGLDPGTGTGTNHGSSQYAEAGHDKSESVLITAKKDAQLTLENSNVKELKCEGDATIILEGNNTVTGDTNKPAISVPEGSTLTIKGNGTLTAIGGSGAAAIGGGPAEGSGNVVIESGTVIAVGGDYAAGIGGGKNGSGGNITIGDGVAAVISIAGENAESIGCGENGTCGTVNIGSELESNTVGNTNTIKQNKEYDLWLGDTRVTALNCTNILDDGTAKYDPETQTLTLDHPKTDLAIRSDGIDLTIKGYYKMSAATGETAVQVTGGSLVLNGDFVFRGSTTAISAGGDVSVKGRTLAYGSTAAISQTGTLTLEPGFFGETRLEQCVGGGEPTVQTVGGTASGDGTAEHPFEIYNNIQWQKACEDVANGCATAGKHFRIDGGFYATTMMGTADNPFAGTLDGGRQYFNIVASICENTAGAALFPYVSGATLRNLCVKGRIIGGDGSAGIIGKAVSGTTTLEECIFDGTVVTLSGLVTENWMVGAKAEGATVTYNNCLDVTICQWPATQGWTYCLTDTDGRLTLTGTTGIQYKGAIWAPKDATVQFTRSNYLYTNIVTSSDSELTLTDGVYSLTMPGEDVAILQNDAVTRDITSPGDITGGNVHTNKTKASAGSPVCIIVTRNDYYLLKSLKVTYRDGEEDKEVPYDEYGIFYMPAKPVTVTAEFVKKYTFENGVLTLKYGTFNNISGNNFDSDVTDHKSEVTKITADLGVRFTGSVSGLFDGFTNCTEIDLSNVETSEMTITANMFGRCNKLKELYMYGWDTSNVTDMSDMFYGCGELGELDLSNFSFDAVTNANGMFDGCGAYILSLPANAAITKEMRLSKGSHDNDWNWSGWQKLGDASVVSAESEVVYDSNNNQFTYAVIPAQTEASTFVWKEMPSDFVLELPDGRDNRALVELWDGMTVNAKLTGRTLYKDGNWNTLCLPFYKSGAAYLGATELMHALGNDYTINELTIEDKFNSAGERYNSMWTSNQNEEDFHYQTGYDESGALSLYFIPSYTMYPGKPYIIKWTKPDGYVAYNGENAATCSDIVSPTFESVTISKTLSSVTSEDDAVSFCGTYDYRHFPVDNRSLLFLGTENSLFYPQAGAKIGPERAYFQLNGITAGDLSANGVRMFFGGEDDATSIQNSRFEIQNGAGAVYDLSGRRIDNAKLSRGIYIRNGRKVVVK